MEKFPKATVEEVELDLKYAGYLKRQDREAEKVLKSENVMIPEDFDYDAVDGISAESR